MSTEKPQCFGDGDKCGTFAECGEQEWDGTGTRYELCEFKEGCRSRCSMRALDMREYASQVAVSAGVRLPQAPRRAPPPAQPIPPVAAPMPPPPPAYAPPPVAPSYQPYQQPRRVMPMQPMRPQHPQVQYQQPSQFDDMIPEPRFEGEGPWRAFGYTILRAVMIAVGDGLAAAARNYWKAQTIREVPTEDAEEETE